MAQFARPDSTVSAGTWDPVGGPSTLWECLDEVSASDTDYIEALNGENTTCELGLSTVTDPVSNINHTIRFRMQGTGSGGPERCNVELYDGATLIAETGNQTSRGAWGDREYTLSDVEADAITDYSDLRLKIISSNLGGTEDMWVSWAEFEVPDVAGTDDEEWAGTQADVNQPRHLRHALLVAGTVFVGVADAPFDWVTPLSEPISVKQFQYQSLFEPLEPIEPGANTESVVATAVGVPTINLTAKLARSVAAVGSPDLSYKIFHGESAVATGVPDLSLLAKLSLEAISSGQTSSQRLVRKSIGGTALGVAGIQRFVFKLLATTALGVPTESASFIGETPDFGWYQQLSLPNLDPNRPLPFLTAGPAPTGAHRIETEFLDQWYRPFSEPVLPRLNTAYLRGGDAVRVDLGISAANSQTVTATALGVPFIQKTVGKNILVTAAAQTAVQKFISLSRDVTATGDPGINFKVKKALAEIVAGVTELAKKAGKRIAGTAVGEGAIGKFVFSGLSVVATGVADLNKTVFKTLSAIATGVANVANQTPTVLTQITITAIATGIAALSTLYIQFFAPFSGGSGLGILDQTATRWKRRARTWKARR